LLHKFSYSSLVSIFWPWTDISGGKKPVLRSAMLPPNLCSKQFGSIKVVSYFLKSSPIIFILKFVNSSIIFDTKYQLPLMVYPAFRMKILNDLLLKFL